LRKRPVTLTFVTSQRSSIGTQDSPLPPSVKKAAQVLSHKNPSGATIRPLKGWISLVSLLERVMSKQQGACTLLNEPFT
jgi:hypothetical protein